MPSKQNLGENVLNDISRKILDEVFVWLVSQTVSIKSDLRKKFKFILPANQVSYTSKTLFVFSKLETILLRN